MEATELVELEKRLSDALARRDAKSLAMICNSTGIGPQDRELYQEGAAILSREREQRELLELVEKQRDFEMTLASRIPIERYGAFLSNSEKMNLNALDLYSGTIHKRCLLLNFFHEDFGIGKPRDLRLMVPHDVGTAFKEMFEYAKKRTDEKRKCLAKMNAF